MRADKTWLERVQEIDALYGGDWAMTIPDDWQEQIDLARITASLDRLAADLEKGTRMDFKDIGIRALKTATQTFIGALGLGLTPLLNVSTLHAAAFAAAAAAIAVIENAVLAWSGSK